MQEQYCCGIFSSALQSIRSWKVLWIIQEKYVPELEIGPVCEPADGSVRHALPALNQMIHAGKIVLWLTTIFSNRNLGYVEGKN